MSNAKGPKGPSQRRPGAAKATAARSQPSAARWIVAAVVGLVVVAGIVAVVFARGSTSDSVSSPVPDVTVPAQCGGTGGGDAEVAAFRPVDVTGESLPESGGNGRTDPAVGQPAPPLSGRTFDGSAITLPCPDQATLMIFVAHWCPHCQREVPALVDYWAENGQPEGVEVVTVATGTDEDRPNFPPAAWLAREDWPAPTLVDDQDQTAAQAYGLSGFPFFVLVGADGEVLSRASGEADPAELDNFVETLVGTGTGAGA